MIYHFFPQIIFNIFGGDNTFLQVSKQLRTMPKNWGIIRRKHDNKGPALQHSWSYISMVCNTPHKLAVRFMPASKYKKSATIINLLVGNLSCFHPHVLWQWAGKHTTFLSSDLHKVCCLFWSLRQSVTFCFFNFYASSI